MFYLFMSAASDCCRVVFNIFSILSFHVFSERSGRDKRIERAVGICKRVVSAFSYSWKKKRDLAQAQEDLRLPAHKLATESQTRWDSRQKMVGRVLEQEKAIRQVLSADKKSRHLVPSWQDIDVLESFHKALNPLLEFTDALSGEDYVSISYLKPILHLFNEKILKHDYDDNELTKSIKTAVLEYMNEKYDHVITDDLLDIASLLDPRFKTMYIKDDKIDTIKARAVTEMLAEGAAAAGSTGARAEGGAGVAGDCIIIFILFCFAILHTVCIRIITVCVQLS